MHQEVRRKARRRGGRGEMGGQESYDDNRACTVDVWEGCMKKEFFKTGNEK